MSGTADVIRCLLVTVLLAATASASGQTPTADKDKGDKATPVTMSGCVTNGGSPQTAVTFADGDTGNKYRLTGKSVKQYTGQRVEIVGGTPPARKIAIKGGLYPSPNVAAQAGALDPAKAAIAAQPGGPESGTGAVDLLPEFRVSRVRVVPGACQ